MSCGPVTLKNTCLGCAPAVPLPMLASSHFSFVDLQKVSQVGVSPCTVSTEPGDWLPKTIFISCRCPPFFSTLCTHPQVHSPLCRNHPLPPLCVWTVHKAGCFAALQFSLEDFGGFLSSVPGLRGLPSGCLSPAAFSGRWECPTPFPKRHGTSPWRRISRNMCFLPLQNGPKLAFKSPKLPQ